MKAAIQRAMSVAAQTSAGSDKCQAILGDGQWQTRMKEFRRKRYYLECNCMIMGPAKAFPEYFPPDFDFDKYERHVVKQKKTKTSTCKRTCAGDHVPGAYERGLQCELLTHIPLNYTPQYLKSHEHYCGCRDDLCAANKRSVGSHEPCK